MAKLSTYASHETQKADKQTNRSIGRSILGRSIAIRMGRPRNRSLHRSLSRRSSNVRSPLHIPPPLSSCATPTNAPLSPQRYLHHRLLNPRRWCPRPTHSHQEFNLHHLLRSRCHLRCHHVHHLLRQAIHDSRRKPVFRSELLYGICVVLGWVDGWNVQFDLWC